MLANFQWFEPIPGSTGKPSPLYDIQLVDADGNSCEDGEEGTIAVMDVKNHPPTGLFTGYFQNPEMTQRSWAAPTTTPATWPGGTATATTGLWAATTT